MKISELINDLKNMKDEFGDADVTFNVVGETEKSVDVVTERFMTDWGEDASTEKQDVDIEIDDEVEYEEIVFKQKTNKFVVELSI